MHGRESLCMRAPFNRAAVQETAAQRMDDDHCGFKRTSLQAAATGTRVAVVLESGSSRGLVANMICSCGVPQRATTAGRVSVPSAWKRDGLLRARRTDGHPQFTNRSNDSVASAARRSCGTKRRPTKTKPLTRVGWRRQGSPSERDSSRRPRCHRRCRLHRGDRDQVIDPPFLT